MWLLGFAGCGGGMYTFYVASKPVAEVAQGFMTDLAAGNVAGAQGRCEPSITTEELENMATVVKGHGAYKDMTLPVRSSHTEAGDTKWELLGAAVFDKGSQPVHFQLRKQSDGSYKVVSVDIGPDVKPSSNPN